MDISVHSSLIRSNHFRVTWYGSVQKTKGRTVQWPARDLFFSIWWCVHCFFWAAAFHLCLPAAVFPMAAIVLPTRHFISFIPGCWSEKRCWCAFALMKRKLHCVYFNIAVSSWILLLFQCVELLFIKFAYTSMQEGASPIIRAKDKKRFVLADLFKPQCVLQLTF